MSKLLVVFPVCASDIAAAKEIALWINTGATFEGEYTCLIAADFNTPAEDIVELAALHAGSFAEVLVTQLYDAAAKQQWPVPQNHMFKRVAQEVAWVHAKRFDSFFFCEPDVTPLTEDWLPTFEQAFRASRKPFFGHIGPTRVFPPGVTAKSHMNGAAIYPANAIDHSPRFVIGGGTPWDVFASEDVLPICGDAKELLVKQFKTTEFKLDQAGNVVCRQHYPRRNGEIVDNSLVEPFLAYAVLHHGCKDGSLLQLIRGLRSPSLSPTELQGMTKSIEPIGFKEAPWISAPVLSEKQQTIPSQKPLDVDAALGIAEERVELGAPKEYLDGIIKVYPLKKRKKGRMMKRRPGWKPPTD